VGPGAGGAEEATLLVGRDASVCAWSGSSGVDVITGDATALDAGVADGPASGPVAWELGELVSVAGLVVLRVRFVLLVEGDAGFSPISERAVVSPAT